MPILSLSTCWNSSRHRTGDDCLREIVDMGFEYAELSHGLNIHHMEGMLRFVEDGGIKVSSLHNFCPQPIEVTTDSPDCYQFSSSRPEVCQRAVKVTLQTIDFAKRFGANRIVLHSGTVSRMVGFGRELIDLVMQGEFLSKTYVEKKLDGVRRREEASPDAMHRLKETLKPVIAAAGEAGIRLGIENRDSYEQLPSEREFPELLDELGPVCGYWHDFGHAQRKQNLALMDHAQWLHQMGSRAIGCHVHDCMWPVEDHQVPFLGQIDFPALVPSLPPDIPFVIELHPKRPAAEVLASVEQWKTTFPQFAQSE
jgi:sugar phosphate isomerase/epimerase